MVMQKQTANTVQRGRGDVRPGKFSEALGTSLKVDLPRLTVLLMSKTFLIFMARIPVIFHL
jgi:hypothetical protein